MALWLYSAYIKHHKYSATQVAMAGRNVNLCNDKAAATLTPVEDLTDEVI